MSSMRHQYLLKKSLCAVLSVSLVAACSSLPKSGHFAADQGAPPPPISGTGPADTTAQPEPKAAQKPPATEQRDPSAAPVTSDAIGRLLKRAVDDSLIAGGVVLVGNSSGILSVTARGKLRSKDAPPLDEDTLFDLASLTKVVATAPAIMKLVDDGQLALADPITKWFPEFRRSRHAEITVADLLTHTSGLADLRLHRGQSLQSVIRKAAAERPTGGYHHFNYADINFILLGELVHRVSGKPLDVFCRDQLFLPLGMDDTMFRPPENIDDEIAPTDGAVGGVVQDLTARRLGKVAGHAGLFSSARDLSRFARLMLGSGELDGRRYFSESSMAQMTAPHVIRADAVSRGLGWDVSSRYSAPKSRLFSENSFGHTGYSGSSIWIDPQTDLYVIVLTVRRNYHDPHIFNLFREDVSTVAAAEFGKPETVRQDVSEQEQSQIGSELTSWERQRSLARLHNEATVHHRRHHGHGKHPHLVRAKYVKRAGKAHKGRSKA